MCYLGINNIDIFLEQCCKCNFYCSKLRHTPAYFFFACILHHRLLLKNKIEAFVNSDDIPVFVDGLFISHQASISDVAFLMQICKIPAAYISHYASGS